MVCLTELQTLEGRIEIILVTDNVLCTSKVSLRILIISIYHICADLIDRHSNTDSMLAISMHHN